ncbi:Protein of unknown function [Bacillus toyonensis]|jgi:ATP-binding cassette subfamily B (MDR/TAP) protein 1
MKD